MSNKNNKIPVTYFDLSNIAAEERFQIWRESISVIFEVNLKTEEQAESFHAKISSSHLSSLLLGTCTSQQQFFNRSQRLINTDSLDHFLLQLYTQGETSGQWGKHSNFTVQAGDLFLLDLSQPIESFATDFSNITLVIPRSILQQHLPNLEKYHGCILPRANAFNQLLRTHLFSLLDVVPQLSIEEATIAAEGVTCLLGNYFRQLSPISDSSHLQASLRESIRYYIRQNISHPDLTPVFIAAHFKMSRSYLYKLFEPENGIRHYIQQQRLRLAFRQLRNDTQHRLRIGQLAFSLGFSSESHFCRSFQQMFGMTPSAARDCAMAFAQNSDLHSPNQWDRGYEEWVRNL